MPKQLSSGLMFGHWLSIAVPDIARCDHLLILGANPMASNGSLWTVPDFRGKAKAMHARGGKLVVIDPRRTETAEIADRHLPIRPGGDAFLLLGMVHTLFAEGLVRLGRLAEHVAGVDELRAAGITMTLLSGDRRPVVEAIARQLGGMEVIAEVMPQDKDQVIQRLQQSGAIVAMVGDGVNDAPALIRADVGIALGSGTDVSVGSADIVLMYNELDKVRQATQLSRRTLLTIKQNIGLSFVYNAIMVPLAMMAMVSPLVAAISMPISSLIVIGNAARIRTLFRKR